MVKKCSGGQREALMVEVSVQHGGQSMVAISVVGQCERFKNCSNQRLLDNGYSLILLENQDYHRADKSRFAAGISVLHAKHVPVLPVLLTVYYAPVKGNRLVDDSGGVLAYKPIFCVANFEVEPSGSQHREGRNHKNFMM